MWNETCTAYSSRLRIVRCDWGNPVARDVLVRYGATASSRDWRRWEWFHLQAKTEGREVFREIEIDTDVDAVADHPDGVQLAFGAAEKIIVWNQRDHPVVSSSDALRLKGSPIVWNEDATRIACIRSDGSISGIRQPLNARPTYFAAHQMERPRGWDQRTWRTTQL